LQWRSKELQGRGSSFRPESKGGGTLFEWTGKEKTCKADQHKTQPTKFWKPLGNLTSAFLLKIQLLIEIFQYKLK
jgi:hypothetical protein